MNVRATPSVDDCLVRPAGLGRDPSGQGERRVDHIALGQLLDLNHSILSSLMLCTTKLDEMCQIARSAGALGAKMTGGGGGGCMIALAPKHDEATRICDVLGEGAFVAGVSA